MSDAGKIEAQLRAIAKVRLPHGASEEEIADFVRGLAILDDVTLRARRVAERLSQHKMQP
ncbi:hypothetical protein [Sinorhizobium meliloti]|uniref:hypothetical protein n=1 Tax=Rhizobium meliloti TaxID=382 RepID=UPI000FDC8B8E|nr:hypothetical protein [Sinorhizobium meliloti]RVG91824.1 hypothetical protein CN218_19310 [Sinorhizobium meliloti]